MIDLLIRSNEIFAFQLLISCNVLIRGFCKNDKFSCGGIPHSFGNTQFLIETTDNEVAVSPRFIDTDISTGIPFSKTTVQYITIILISIISSRFCRSIYIPIKTVRQVTPKICIVSQAVIICTVTAYNISFYCSRTSGLIGNNIDNTCHSIAAIYKRGGAFEYFSFLRTQLVYFNTMLIAPLLPFLPNAIINCYNSVVS